MSRCAIAASLIVAGVGATTLVGWDLGISVLKTILPGSTAMSGSAALSLLIAGISLFCNAQFAGQRAGGKEQRWSLAFVLGMATSGIVILLGAVRLAEYFNGWTPIVDRLLFYDPPGTPNPARMAPSTALDLVLLGSAMCLWRTSWLKAFQFLSLLGGLVSWLGLERYLYRGTPLVQLSQMAVHTAASFSFLTVGILCLRPDCGLMKLLIADSPGGVLARRLVPAALFAPPLMGWLRLLGQRAGWYGTEAGISLFALANVLVFGTLIWINASLLNDSDEERKRAERRVHAQLERLGLLQQITRAIGERQDVQSIFQAVIRRLEDHLPMDFCCICLYDALAPQAVVATMAGMSESIQRELAINRGDRIRVDENGLARCVRGHLVYEPDVRQIPFPFPQRLARAGLRSMVAAPMAIESQVFGLVILARTEQESFSSGDCEFLKQLSEHVGLAARQAELHTALQRAYDDLQATQDAVMQQERLRVLGQMASGIAHDINNALAPVSLYTEMLLEGEPNLSRRTREYLETTQMAIGDVSHTIGRMGEFYRQKAADLQFQPVDLNRITREAVDLTRARWSTMPQQRGIVVSMRQDLMTDLPAVAAIESEIREALTNLVFNAVDAMPEGGTLTLRTRVAKKLVCIEVEDTGAGMDEATQRRCLEPFFTTKGERGTGLGLAMVHGIARRHNSELEIESEPGKGTIIRIVFPAGDAGKVADARGADEIPASRRILLVDDDPLVLRSLRDVLAHDGHTVEAANGGREGIDAFRAAEERKEPFEVVVTDLGMPYVDGHKVAAAVKTLSPGTGVILLTGWGQRLAAEGEVPPNVDCMLNKPPKLREIREALNLMPRSVP